jgi:oligopeptide transport system substrate-binding protein
MRRHLRPPCLLYASQGKAHSNRVLHGTGLYHLLMNLHGLASRRQLIQMGTTAGVTAAFSRGFALAAQPATPIVWSPDAGLRLAGPVEGLVSLDPALSRDVDTNFIVRQICRGLVGYDTGLNPVPELAETIDISADQRTYSFTIRPDARFHDDRPVEADDVLYSLSRALDPATSGGNASALAGVIYLRDIVGADDVLAGRATSLTGVEILDASRLSIRLLEPSATFLMKLAAVPASVLDRHQSTADPQWWQAINGSGPFQVRHVDAAEMLELAPTASWRPNTIAISQVSIRLGPGANQPVNLFQAGEIDLVPAAQPLLISLAEDPATGIDDGTVIETPQFSLAYIALGNQRPPLDDLQVRRAIQLAFPASRFADARFEDRVLPATGVVPPGMLGEAMEAVMPGVDLDAARAAIAASRYGSAERVPPIRIHAADIAPVEALRDVVTRDLGLVVEAVQVNWLDFMNGLAAQRWNAYLLIWGADYPDPEAFLWMLFGSESSENYTGYSNPTFDDTIAQSRQELDDATRRDVYMRAQQMLIDDVAVIPLYFPVGYTLARSGMNEIPVTPMGLLGLETIT